MARGQIYAVTELFGLGFRHPALMRPLQRLALRYLESGVPDPELRLITCDGTFDVATGHYLSNIVVYATEIS